MLSEHWPPMHRLIKRKWAILNGKKCWNTFWIIHTIYLLMWRRFFIVWNHHVSCKLIANLLSFRSYLILMLWAVSYFNKCFCMWIVCKFSRIRSAQLLSIQLFYCTVHSAHRKKNHIANKLKSQIWFTRLIKSQLLYAISVSGSWLFCCDWLILFYYFFKFM